METEHVRVPKPVYDRAVELKKKRGLATIGEAIRHMCRNGDFDV